MRTDAKRQLMTHLATGHKHTSMTEMAGCGYCGAKFQKGKALFEKMQRETPEVFEYTPPEFTPSQETKNMFGMLMERIKKDTAYRRHVEKMAGGTEAEKDEELKKVNEGYYRKHGI